MSNRPLTEMERLVVSHAELLVSQINESLHIANKSSDIGTRRSRDWVAKQKIGELQDIVSAHPILSICRLDAVLADIKKIELETEQATAAGSVDGGYYADHVDRVKELKRCGHLEEAARLLARLIDAVEAEGHAMGQKWKVPPWYYEQLGIVFRKMKRRDLSDRILARYNALPGAAKVLQSPQGRTSE